MIAQTNSFQGSRLSSARAFVRPARNRPNFHVMLNSTVRKIIFDNNKKAVAVEFNKDGKLHKVGVKKEVIVSGGNFNKFFSITVLFFWKINFFSNFQELLIHHKYY